MYNAFNTLTSLYNNPASVGFNYQNQPRQEIVKVSGEPGARSYQMGPNSSAILLDIDKPLVWVVQTDGAGYKTVTPYKIEPYQPEAVENDLERRIRKLEETIYESDFINAKSAKQQEPVEPNLSN